MNLSLVRFLGELGGFQSLSQTMEWLVDQRDDR